MTITLETLLSGSATVAWDNTAMSGTSKRVTEAIDLGSGAREASWYPDWADTSTVLGAFGVDLSNDNTTWTPGVLDVDFSALGPAVASNDDTQLVHGAFRARYVRLTYTNVSGTGTLIDGLPVIGKKGVRGRALLPTPLNIFSGAVWVNPDTDFVNFGTPPAIQTLTNRYDSGYANPTQPIVARRPDQVDFNGKKYSEHTSGNLEGLTAAGISPPLYPAGATSASVFCSATVEDWADGWHLFDVGATNGTGISARAASTNIIRAGVVLDTGPVSVDAVVDTTSDTLFRFAAVWNGTNFRFWVNNVLQGTATPAGGSVITAAASSFSYGAQLQAAAANSFWAGRVRDMVVTPDAATQAQLSAMDSFLLRNS